MKKKGKLLTIMLSVMLALTLVAAGGYFAASAAPEDTRFDHALGDSGVDLKSIAGSLLEGEILLPYQDINRTIADELDDDELRQLRLVPDDTQHGLLWARAWVEAGGREWIATLRLHTETVMENGAVQGIRLTLTELAVGKLEVPEVLWPLLLNQAAEKADLTVDGSTILYELPELDWKLVQVKDIRTEPRGFVLELGLGSLFG